MKKLLLGSALAALSAMPAMPEAMTRAFGKSSKVQGKHLRVFARLKDNPVMPSRAARRNAARQDHSLHAWKKPHNHLMNRNGSVIVPFPFHDIQKPQRG